MANYTYGPSQISDIISKLAEGGNNITLTAGTYTINKNSSNYGWKFGSNTTLTGPRSAILLMGTRGYPDSPLAGMLLLNNVSNVTISGISITGNATNSGYGTLTNIVIAMAKVSNITITNCYFSYCDSDFIKMRGASYVNINYNTMYYPGHECCYIIGSTDTYGVNHHIEFHHNECRLRTNSACRVSYTANNISIHHNVISATHSGITADCPGIEVDWGPSHTIDIYQNTFTNIKGAGVWVFTNYGASSSYGIHIHENTFTNCGYGGYNYGSAAIEFYQSNTCIIENNRFVSNGKNGAIHIFRHIKSDGSYFCNSLTSQTYYISFLNNRGATSADINYVNTLSNHKVTSSGNAVGAGGGAGGTIIPPPDAPKTPAVTLTCSPTSVTSGATTAFTWSVTNCTSATLSKTLNGTTTKVKDLAGVVNSTTKKTVTENSDVLLNTGQNAIVPVFTITGYNNTTSPIQSATAQCQVTVNPVIIPAPTYTDFYASPNTPVIGESVMVFVKGIKNTTSLTLDGESIQFDGNGNAQKLYTFTSAGVKVIQVVLTGPTGKSLVNTLSIICMDAPTTLPPTLSFTVTKTIIDNGMSVTFDWDCTNAKSVTFTPASVFPVGVFKGQLIISPLVTTTYNMKVIGNATVETAVGNIIEKSITVTVNDPVTLGDPRISLKLTPEDPIDIYDSAVISWTTEFTSTLTVDNNIGSVSAASGSITVSPITSTTYTFTAENDDNTTYRSIDVVVNGGNPHALFVASPQNIYAGASSKLAWMSQYAHDATISPNVGVVNHKRGTYEVSPTESTTYTLTVSGSNQTIVKTVDVIVEPVPTDTTLYAEVLPDNPLINLGEDVTLSWAASGGEAISCDNDVGILEYPSGDKLLTPLTTTEYRFIVASDLDTIERVMKIYVVRDYSIIETVVPVLDQEFIDITAKRVYVSGGQSTSDTLYTWDIDRNNSIRSNPSDTMITFAYDKHGFYTLVLTSVDKDGDTTRQVIRANVTNA